MAKVLIWGCNPFASQLYYFVRDTIDVVAFVDEHAERRVFCDLPVYTPQALAAKEEFCELPVVVALPHALKNQVPTCNFETIRQFKLALQKIVHKYQIKHQLLHPVALIDFVDVKFPNKSITFGLPGAGNTLYAEILQTLDRALKRGFALPNISLFFEQLGFEYTQLVHQVISDFLFLHNGHQVHPIPWKVNTTSFCGQVANDEINIYAFMTREHFLSAPFGYHQMPSHALLKTLSDGQFKLFFILRNPLDILLSLVNKNLGLNKGTGEIDMITFVSLGRLVIHQLKAWHPYLEAMIERPRLKYARQHIPGANEKALYLLRYEDLIASPQKYLKQLVTFCSQEVSHAKLFFHYRALKRVKQTWQRFAFKQLPSAPEQHFWQGGRGKWQTYFKPEHLSFLKAFGMEEILALYDYPEELLRFQKSTANLPGSLWESHCPPDLRDGLLQRQAFYYRDEYDDTLQTLLALDKPFTERIGQLVLNASSVQTLKYFKSKIDNDFVHVIAKAGVHPTKSHFLT